jgi:hypothetical protein
MQKARFSPTRMDFPKNSSGGGVEYWNNGVLEYWNNGVLEYWSIGVLEFWSFGVLEFWGVGVLEDWLLLSTVRFASEQSAKRVVRWWKICMVWFEETPERNVRVGRHVVGTTSSRTES